ncbi:MAG: hypothetical protein JNL06_11360, partial [Alphaproteobacteria bacterium]|nr:hypothetical protein [Alphaproteobacteria bacterium]
EDAVLKHPDVNEAAAIGVPDGLRGLVVKAFSVRVDACAVEGIGRAPHDVGRGIARADKGQHRGGKPKPKGRDLHGS